MMGLLVASRILIGVEKERIYELWIRSDISVGAAPQFMMNAVVTTEFL